jgi:hypothetical protein
MPLGDRLPGFTIAIVEVPLLRVLEHLVRLVHILEALLGARLFADIGVILASELAVCTLDLVLGRRARDFEHFIVVLVSHAALASSQSILQIYPRVKYRRAKYGRDHGANRPRRDPSIASDLAGEPEK